MTLKLCAPGVFKSGNFAVETWGRTAAPPGHAPAIVENLAQAPGISFDTLHAISYLIELYRCNAKPIRNLIEGGLYILFFSQPIAGPIVRCKDIHDPLRNRSLTLENLGAENFRFTTGLAKTC
ncbi:hypothetical protein MB84_28475 (plasmid) [Pandoraea oxalativorans]|uniref:Uncharacterized protein n=1 Tax=Pandoraea oxalativorans TaxID=573737 RepID=A0A0G3IBW1_9BURK|nr:hypothetical protein MB84_28475 [Pandoraea oxalativorans]